MSCCSKNFILVVVHRCSKESWSSWMLHTKTDLFQGHLSVLSPQLTYRCQKPSAGRPSLGPSARLSAARSPAAPPFFVFRPPRAARMRLGVFNDVMSRVPHAAPSPRPRPCTRRGVRPSPWPGRAGLGVCVCFVRVVASIPGVKPGSQLQFLLLLHSLYRPLLTSVRPGGDVRVSVICFP